eukprot:TRINITY_DN39620_c0_g1_i1.p1 TRINITY_DN39620_c0_g1~~TRINITY_DN39620_c0_g1_i1.p1  ORF type:complete len:101 (+),score=25.13 TRINITY_DN39620_c0_g1_i1:65-367(+)
MRAFSMIFCVVLAACVASVASADAACSSDEQSLLHAHTSPMKKQKPLPRAAAGFGFGAMPSKGAKGAKQHSMLQLKTTLSKVVLPADAEDEPAPSAAPHK